MFYKINKNIFFNILIKKIINYIIISFKSLQFGELQEKD